MHAFAATLTAAALGCASQPVALPAPPPEIGTTKPVPTAELIAAATPKLAEYVARVLPGQTLATRPVGQVRLLKAKPFSEGHVNETWFLKLDVDGAQTALALKIFPTPEGADASAWQFATARAKGWRVPREYVRGATRPYTDRHGLLMEFIPGGSLASHIRRRFRGGATPDVDDIAALYGAVAEELGRVHEKNRKWRTTPRRAGRDLGSLAARCAAEGWCGKAARTRLDGLAARMNGGQDTFTHGDLYEQQVIMTRDGELAAFIDLDQARFDDPAADVGAMLGHILLVNPVARRASAGVPNPTPEETQASAQQFIDTYRQAAWLRGEAWTAFSHRVRGYVWLRLATLLHRYAGNPHAAALFQALDASKQRLTERDPFEAYGVEL